VTITPVVPVADSQLVVDSQGIILDTDVAFVSVRVYISSWVDVWNSTSGFLNSWTGNFISYAGGERLVLDPPTSFSVGDIVYVNAWDTGGPIDYQFRVGLEKLTTEADLSAPQVVKVDTYTWSARVHNNEDPGGLPALFDGPGNVYLHVLDPRGSEILVVPGQEVGLVWDEGSNKVIIYFVRNETVFYMEADPGDTPSTQSQLRSLETTVRSVHGGEGDRHNDDATFPPIKQLVPEPVGFVGGGEGFFSVNTSPHNAAPAPNIISGALDGAPVVLRIERPTTSHESDLLVGYYVVKFWRDTPSIIGFVSMAIDDDFVEFSDSCLTPGATYGVMPLYYTWVAKDDAGTIVDQSPETRRESWGDKAPVEPGGVSQLIEPSLGGEGIEPHVDDQTFPPLKQAVIESNGMIHGGQGEQYWADSSFDPIGT
jgi:hypothetical protein